MTGNTPKTPSGMFPAEEKAKPAPPPAPPPAPEASEVDSESNVVISEQTRLEMEAGKKNAAAKASAAVESKKDK